MGMESYYVSIMLDKQAYNDSLSLLKQKCRISPYCSVTGGVFKKRIAGDSRFVIDNKAVASAELASDTVKITFELCFANYENNLKYLFGSAQQISELDKTAKLKVLNSEYYLANLDYEKFEHIVTQAFRDKIAEFNGRYGKINSNILPNRFYDRIGRKIMLSTFTKTVKPK